MKKTIKFKRKNDKKKKKLKFSINLNFQIKYLNNIHFIEDLN